MPPTTPPTDPAIPLPPPVQSVEVARPAIPPPPPPYVPPGPDEHRGRRRRRLGTAALVAAVVVGVLVGYGPAGAVLAGFALLSPLERAFRRHPWTVRRRHVGTDVAHLLFSGTLLTGATIAGVVVVYLLTWPVHRGSPGGPIATLPGWASALVGLALFEVTGYWYHRLSHEVPLLWRFHRVHHSSSRLDWIAAARLHPLEGFWAVVVIGPPLLLAGVQPVQLGVLNLVTQLWALLLHANVRWRLAALDGILGTPEHHHWHHSTDPAAWNANYSGLLPPLDRLFGTFYRSSERRPAAYGIAEPVPEGWWAQMAWPLRRRLPVDHPLEVPPSTEPAGPGRLPSAG